MEVDKSTDVSVRRKELLDKAQKAADEINNLTFVQRETLEEELTKLGWSREISREQMVNLYLKMRKQMLIERKKHMEAEDRVLQLLEENDRLRQDIAADRQKYFEDLDNARRLFQSRIDDAVDRAQQANADKIEQSSKYEDQINDLTRQLSECKTTLKENGNDPMETTETLNDKIDALQAKYAKSISDLEKAEETLRRVKKEEKEKNLKQLDTCLELDRELRLTKHDLLVMEMEFKQLAETKTDTAASKVVTEMLESRKTELEDKDNKIATLQKQLQDCNEDKDKLQTQLDECEARTRRSTAVKAERSSTTADLQRENNNLKAELAKALEDNETQQKTIAEVMVANNTLRTKLEECDKALAELKTEVFELQLANQKYNRTNGALTRKLAELEQKAAAEAMVQAEVDTEVAAPPPTQLTPGSREGGAPESTATMETELNAEAAAAAAAAAGAEAPPLQTLPTMDWKNADENAGVDENNPEPNPEVFQAGIPKNFTKGVPNPKNFTTSVPAYFGIEEFKQSETTETNPFVGNNTEVKNVDMADEKTAKEVTEFGNTILENLNNLKQNRVVDFSKEDDNEITELRSELDALALSVWSTGITTEQFTRLREIVGNLKKLRDLYVKKRKELKGKRKDIQRVGDSPDDDYRLPQPVPKGSLQPSRLRRKRGERENDQERNYVALQSKFKTPAAP